MDFQFDLKDDGSFFLLKCCPDFVSCLVKIWVSCNPRNPANENTSRQGPGNLVSKELVGRCVMELKKAMNERIT